MNLKASKMPISRRVLAEFAADAKVKQEERERFRDEMRARSAQLDQQRFEDACAIAAMRAMVRAASGLSKAPTRCALAALAFDLAETMGAERARRRKRPQC